jgi:hypothetical protein
MQQSEIQWWPNSKILLTKIPGNYRLGNSVSASSITGPNATSAPHLKATVESMADPTREEIDAKLAALDAKNDARFERMVGEMRTSQAELSGRVTGALGELKQELRGDYAALKASTAGKLTVILTGISSTLAVLAIVIAVIFGLAASGQTMFGLGQSTRDIATTAGTAAGTAAAERVMAGQAKKPGS